MMESAINRVVSGRPSEDHSIVFYQLGEQRRLSLEALNRLALRVAVHLRRIGVREGDRIGIVAKNRLEWVLLDLAALRIKAVTAGFEAGKFSATQELIERYDLRLLFSDEWLENGSVRSIQIKRIDRLLEEAGDIGPEPDLTPVTYDPAEVTTIKFTSGSTGVPKGLAATAGSIDSSIAGVQTMFAHGYSDKLFVFLPLSLLQQRYWIYSALAFGHDIVVTNYELAYWALSREEPTVVMGVPGFFEGLRKEISRRAERRSGTETDGMSKAAMHRKAAQEVLGSRIRYLWTGSAPASPEMLQYFIEYGIPIFEGYGLNETCIVTKNTPSANKLGSVGRPLPGKRVSLDPAGVVIVSSDHPVNTKYLYAAPGDSERIFMPDGSVRTGDLGRIDDDGYLYILGRADDVVVLENGHNVLVRPIEERLAGCASVEQCIVVGFGSTSLIAIIYAHGGGDECTAISDHIAKINSAAGSDDRIGGFILADEPFSIENGLLTSQYKPRRRAIEMRYEREIKAAYGAV